MPAQLCIGVPAQHLRRMRTRAARPFSPAGAQTATPCELCASEPRVEGD